MARGKCNGLGRPRKTSILVLGSSLTSNSSPSKPVFSQKSQMTTPAIASMAETSGNISTVNNSKNLKVVEDNRMSKVDNRKSKIQNDCAPSSSNVTIIEKAQSIVHANENSQKLEAN